MTVPPDLLHLQRVVPVMETRELGQSRLTCVALELYDDGAWINFWIEIAQGTAPEVLPMLEAAASDDLGNHYMGWIGGGYGGDSSVRFGHRLGPAIAPDASALTVRIRVRESGRGPGSTTRPVAWGDFDEASATPGVEPIDYTAVTVSLTRS